MDLKDNLEQSLENLNENISENNSNIRKGSGIVENISKNYCTIVGNNIEGKLNLKEKYEDVFFYSLNDKKKYEENIILFKEIYDHANFIKLLDVQNTDDICFLIFEKPNISLLQFLMKNKEDVYLRFSLFKQALDIIFKLISLKQQFDFFNFGLFFVLENNQRPESNPDSTKIKASDWKLTELKIYYHSNFYKYFFILFLKF